MSAITVGVVGALGRMGRSICAGVAAADGLELVAAIDPKGGDETVDCRPVEKQLWLWGVKQGLDLGRGEVGSGNVA